MLGLLLNCASGLEFTNLTAHWIPNDYQCIMHEESKVKSIWNTQRTILWIWSMLFCRYAQRIAIVFLGHFLLPPKPKMTTQIWMSLLDFCIWNCVEGKFLHNSHAFFSNNLSFKSYLKICTIQKTFLVQNVYLSLMFSQMNCSLKTTADGNALEWNNLKEVHTSHHKTANKLSTFSFVFYTV